MELEISNVLKVAVHFSFFVLSLSLFLGLYRLLTGPTLPDRIVVMDLIASVSIGMIITYIIATGQTVFLNVAVAIAIFVFLGNIAFAIYLTRRYKK